VSRISYVLTVKAKFIWKTAREPIEEQKMVENKTEKLNLVNYSTCVKEVALKTREQDRFLRHILNATEEVITDHGICGYLEQPFPENKCDCEQCTKHKLIYSRGPGVFVFGPAESVFNPYQFLSEEEREIYRDAVEGPLLLRASVRCPTCGRSDGER